MRIERVRKLAFNTISQIGISYPGSVLSKTLSDAPNEGPEAGARFPWLKLSLVDGSTVDDLFARLDDTRFNLLLFGQSAQGVVLPSDCAELITMHRVPDSARNMQVLATALITQPCFYLLRPDGYVGLKGGVFDVAALTQYLRDLNFKIAEGALL